MYKDILAEDKRCSKCGEIKPIREFYKSSRSRDGLYAFCKSCTKKKNKEWYKKNSAYCIKKATEYQKKNSNKHRKYTREWARRNKESCRERNKIWSKNNPDKCVQKQMRYIQNHIEARIWKNVHRQFYRFLHGERKSESMRRIVGISKDDFRGYIEEQFKLGMTWDNYGEWHIDHIIPKSWFDPTRKGDQKICFHYTNLQPMWAIENIKKKNSYIG